MMAKSSFTRREFLKISALSSSAMALGACTSLDRLFVGDKRDLSNEVVILGAGAAGLAAAYSLKRRKIPFRLFEASSRIGGRVQSVSLFPEGGPIAELGAEFFDDNHSAVHSLANEFNLPVIEISGLPKTESHIFYFGGQIYNVKDMAARMKTLSKPLHQVREHLFPQKFMTLTYKESPQNEQAHYYDSLTLQDLLNTWSNEVNPLILKLIEVQCVERFGADAQQQSAMHFLSTLDQQGSSLLAGRRTFRMEGGLSQLTSNMYSRVSGVIPNYVVKTQHELVALGELNGVFELTFRTPQGNETYQTKNVICTIPFSKLHQIKGLAEMDFSARKKENIQTQSYATHSKGFLAFSEPFWRIKSGSMPANLGNFTGDFVTQKFWDSGRSQVGTRGLLSFQMGGQAGALAGVHAVPGAVSDLALFYPDIKNKKLLSSQMVNWSNKPWAGGSQAYFNKGQYMRFKGVSSEAEYGGHFLFAGEHTSLDFAGTLNGALETGILAAASIARKISITG